MFTVRVKEDSSIAKEINLEGNVVALAQESKMGALENVKTGLQMGFIVLLIILVILGIIILATKAGRRRNAEEGKDDTQTYY